MTVDEMRIRLKELYIEHWRNYDLNRQMTKDIETLDALMAHYFGAYWSDEDQCYEQ